jgi:hypothetical protein
MQEEGKEEVSYCTLSCKRQRLLSVCVHKGGWMGGKREREREREQQEWSHCVAMSYYENLIHMCCYHYRLTLSLAAHTQFPSNSLATDRDKDERRDTVHSLNRFTLSPLPTHTHERESVKIQ